MREIADGEASNDAALLKQKWRERFHLGIDGIVYRDGRVVLIRCYDDGKLNGRQIVFEQIPESSLHLLMDEDPDCWVKVGEYVSKEYPDQNLRLSCGEGSMGNEGFVAVTELTSGEIIWTAFFTLSNPFVAIRLEEVMVVAENEYEEEWCFPLDEPYKISVRPA